MFAVIRVAGRQITVEPDERVSVPLLDAPVGSIIQCDDVLLYRDGDDIRIGRPRLDAVKVTAEILAHGREDKITVFKMKRRKNYRRTRGHRQGYTVLKIREISS